ncbi:linamarin synthase 2-like isoform X3 [Pyrus x bretschneideri]|uniref:linamarin synthase 2-like isoform X3 n=1 Tax=Pyrus x bretschneideri TaxID=225117 RepID=UPI00202DE4A6|nr:linamarin synthase 2-like isoform X3 [Pyrus x bretschneideri]
MMSSVEQATKKGHAVFVPYPSQGHVTPMMQLAKLLHSRGFHITFVNTEFNHNRLIRSKGPDSVKGLPDFVFETIPDGLPPSDKDGTQDIPALSDSVKKTCLGPFKELVTKINSSSRVPQVSCIVADGTMTFGSKAARELGISEVTLWTASACGFMGYLQYSELVKRGIIPFKDQQTNCRYSCTTWEIGMEVSPDVKRNEIEALVKEMLEGEGGMKMREKAKEWKKKAVEATNVGGSSYNNFERLFKEALQLGE